MYSVRHPLICDIWLSIFDIFRLPVGQTILQLSCSPIVNPNFTTEGMTHSVVGWLFSNISCCVTKKSEYAVKHFVSQIETGKLPDKDVIHAI